MFARLERSAVKVARCVLRGRDGGNTVLLLGVIGAAELRRQRGSRKRGKPGCVVDEKGEGEKV